MKVQIATLALAEKGYMQFKIHLHDDHFAEVLASGENPRDRLRNDLSRHLKRRLGRVPWFFFVLEDRSVAGEETRAHAHGSIEIVRAPLPKAGLGSRRLATLAAAGQSDAAELEAGRIVIAAAMWAASGGKLPRVALTTGIDQTRNVWHRRPYHPLFNSQWVDYAFKNVGAVSKKLPDSRLALPNSLRGEAQRLWRLVKEGESAMDQWD
ncbi:hypothetical protein ACQHGV_08465 [Sphingomonas pseudosanguinis]|uniref:hypothetical protein n=1 Tax=Sphingomonas pseudosanguinis TaxID=413712 RepID=UPI003F87C108